MKTITLTVNDQTAEGNRLLELLHSLSYVTVNDPENIVISGSQAALECGAVSLDAFISELHNRVDIHFNVNK